MANTFKALFIFVMSMIAVPVNAAIVQMVAVVPFNNIQIPEESILNIHYYNEGNWDALICDVTPYQALFNMSWMFHQQIKKIENNYGGFAFCLDGSFNCPPGQSPEADHKGNVKIQNVSGQKLTVSCYYTCLGSPNECSFKKHA